MIRFAWLQTRTQTLVAACLLAALAVAAAVTGVQLSHLYHSMVVPCRSGCDFAMSRFLSHDRFMENSLDLLARAVPALAGVFWGAPLLAREFENGTFRLAWTQSVPRARWLVTKLALGALATASLAGLLTLTITWWYRTFDAVDTNAYGVFDRRDIAPIAYALFAFASGALLGTLLRRTVAAMAGSLALFVLVRVAMSLWVRPHLLPAARQVLSLGNADPSTQTQLGIGFSDGGPLQLFAKGDGPPGSWTLSSQVLNRAGQSVSGGQLAGFLRDHCPGVRTIPPPPVPGKAVPQPGGPAVDAARACLHQVARTFHLAVTYQPANRYWPLQLLESGVFVALAVVAALGCYWRVAHRAG